MFSARSYVSFFLSYAIIVQFVCLRLVPYSLYRDRRTLHYQMSPFKLSASGSVFFPHGLRQNYVIKCYFRIYFRVQKPVSECFLLELDYW